MGDGEQRGFEEGQGTKKGPKVSDFVKLDTLERIRKQSEQDIHDQAKYASEHGVPNTHDILRLADLSLPEVPVPMKIESAQQAL